MVSICEPQSTAQWGQACCEETCFFLPCSTKKDTITRQSQMSNTSFCISVPNNPKITPIIAPISEPITKVAKSAFQNTTFFTAVSCRLHIGGFRDEEDFARFSDEPAITLGRGCGLRSPVVSV